MHRRGDGYELVALGLGDRGSIVVRLDPDAAAGDDPLLGGAALEQLVIPSYDYYSSRDYATRLIGDELLLYVGQSFDTESDGAYRVPPFTLRREGVEEPVEVPREIYAPLVPSIELAVHIILRCDLRALPARCSARGLVGPWWNRSMFVSRTATYLWVGEPSWPTQSEPAALVRLPHDGGAPSALRVHGMPLESLSWYESEGSLHVLVAMNGPGPGMYGAEGIPGRLELFGIELSAFDASATQAPRGAFRRLPTEDHWSGWAPSYAQRWIGGRLLYAAQDGEGPLYVTTPGEESAVSEVTLAHSVERIEAMGGYAVAIGRGGEDVHWSVLSLEGEPHVVAERTLRDLRVDDDRTHAFSYRVLPDGTAVVALPLRSRTPSEGEGAARIELLRVLEGGALEPLGALVSSPDELGGDGCRVSCSDWYGNARPILWRERLFGLLAYELVEGRIDDGRVREVARALFLPAALRGQRVLYGE